MWRHCTSTKIVRNMSGVGIWVILSQNVEALYLHKNSPQYEWSWDYMHVLSYSDQQATLIKSGEWVRS